MHYFELQRMNNNTNSHPLLRTNRGLTKIFFLGLLTFGIYPIIVYSHIGEEINIIGKDGKHTMHYCIIYFLLSLVTYNIAFFVWYHRICNRIGVALQDRNIDYKFSACTFWLWRILGILLFCIGPFVFVHKFMHGMNLLNADYNRNG